MTRQPSWRGVRRVLLAGLLLAACSTSSTSSDSVLLTVSLSGSGTGSVDGQNITCPPDCLDRVDIGSSVSLLASAAQGSMFVEWSKDCSGTGIGTTFTADATPACDAKFDLIDAVTLTIAIDPAGNGTGRVVGPNINCGNGGIQCQATYTRNTSVDLEVEVDVGSTFAGWTGDCLTFGQSLNISLEMNLDKLCSVRYNEPASGALTPRGAFSFDYRIEAAGFRGTRVFTAAFDNPQGPGQVVDFDDPDAPTSPVGLDFSTCSGARWMSRFFYDDVPYNGDVVHTTCTNSRTTGTTPASLGLTQLNFLNYAPGGAGYWSPGKRLAIADFEFGQVRLEHQVSNPQPTVTIPLTAPLVRSCPFAVTVHDTLAFVVGREGEAGTSTENCNNYRGVWKVDLTTNMVTGWLSLGGMLRYAEYGADDKLYVTDYATDKVHVVNPLDMTLNRSISVRDGPVGLKLTPDAGRMLVTNWNINGVQLIDLSNDQEIDYVPSGGVHPVNVLLLGSTVVVLNFGDAATSTGATLKAFTMQ